MRRALPVVVLAVVLAALAVLARVGREREPSPVESAAAEARAEVDARGEHALAQPVTAAAEDDDEEHDAETPLVAATAEAGRSSAAAHAPGEEPGAFVVEVVDAATLAPLANADVLYVVGRGLSPQACIAERLAREGTRARADEAGLARLDAPRAAEVAVLARAGGLAGEDVFAARAVVEAGERRERLLVHPDWDLDVLVLDAGERPAAGVPLTLSARSAGGGWSRGATTDAAGRVVFAGAGHELGRTGRALRVLVRLSFGDDVEAAVERAPPPGEPVVLRLPALGAVDVRVTDELGAAADGANVTLDAPRLARTREYARGTVELVARHVTTVVDGLARFERVGLGVELEVSAASEHASARATLAGPSAPGERVALDLRLVPDRTTLWLRALDEAREPVVGRLDVETSVRSGDASSSTVAQMRSDSDGRFEVTLETSLVSGERRELWVTARGGALRGGVDLSDVLQSAALRSGAVEHGDVVLLAQAPIAAGRVVGEGGEPVEGASVSWSDADGGSPRLLGLETDASGAFALHGSTGAARVTLSAHHRLLQVEPAVVDVGASGVELVARRAGALAGALLLDEGVPRRALALRLVRGGLAPEAPEPALELESAEMLSGGDAWTSEHETFESGVSLRADGSFEEEHLAPGSYRLLVRAGSELLAEVAGLDVRAGETCRDPRLQPLDLRGRMNVFRIELVAPGPDVELAGTLRWAAAGSGAPGDSLDFHASPVVLATPLARIDASVHVEGCRVERLPDLAPTSEVRLRAGYAVRLALPGDVELPAPPLFLGATLADGLDALESARNVDVRGEIALIATEPGPLTVRWCVERRARGRTTRSLLALPERTIVVEERDGEQRFELELTQAELDAALGAR